MERIREEANSCEKVRLIESLVRDAVTKYIGEYVNQSTIENIKSAIRVYLEGAYQQGLVQSTQLQIEVEQDKDDPTNVIIHFPNLKEYLKQFI